MKRFASPGAPRFAPALALAPLLMAGVMLALAVAASPAAAIDLAGVLREVEAANPTLAARRAMTEAARRRVAPAGAWPSPMLEVGAINVPTSGRFDADPMTMKMIGVAQRVPIFGATRLSSGAARAAAGAEAAATTTTRNELLGAATEAYADAYAAIELRRLAAAHVGDTDRLVLSARARYESGAGRLEDVLRAEAEQARTQVDQEALRAEEVVARARLDALRGLDASGPADSLAAAALAPVPADPGAWLSAVTDSLPQLRGAQAQVERYRLAARAARRTAWPDLELKYSYGFRGTLAGDIPQDDMWSASVGFVLPIFAAPRVLSEGAEMDAMAHASEAERRAADLELKRQIVSTYAAATAAQRTVRLYDEAVVPVQKRAVDASWVSYSSGGTDLSRVFEASHTLYGEEIALVRARQDLMRAQSRLLSLTGRGDLLGIALPQREENR